MRAAAAAAAAAFLHLAARSGLVLAEPYVPQEPVIGILTYPASVWMKCGHSVNPGTQGSCIPAAYVQWLEQAGARVVPIKYDLSRAELAVLFKKINGVLFTGGPGKPSEAPVYFGTATALYQMVVDAHAAGETVPLWGTCLGLQTISQIAGGIGVLGDFPLYNYAYPLHFTAEAKSSRLFGKTPQQVLDDFEGNVTTNWHSYGVSPWSVAMLMPNMVPLATNVALNGQVFVSALEGKEGLPIYAVQFHPESNQYSSGSLVEGLMVPSRTPAALRTVQYLANFFVEQARQNQHAFDSQLEEAQSLVQQAAYVKVDKVVDIADLYPVHAYFFPPAQVFV